MKYHSMKMEEVNDTMRHLWNKTYQGTGERSTLIGRSRSSQLVPQTSTVS
jgi:hypothetical protein